MLALLFRVGGDRVALDVRRIEEVVPRVHLQRPAASPAWLAGALLYRGEVVPVVDLHRLAGLGESPALLSSRIILVPLPVAGQGRFLGLLAADVADLEELEATGESLIQLQEGNGPDFGPLLPRPGGMVHLLDPDRLLPDSVWSELLHQSGRGQP